MVVGVEGVGRTEMVVTYLYIRPNAQTAHVHRIHGHAHAAFTLISTNFRENRDRCGSNALEQVSRIWRSRNAYINCQ